MSPAATSRPLITEVIRNVTPVVVPTSPLALSRRSSSISTVTRVISAMDRTFPAITPTMEITMKIHSRTLAGSVKTSLGVSW